MIILVRHGQTEWNVERRMQGRLESSLTDLGRRQARAMGGLVRELVRREHGDWRLVSSPLSRAHDTAHEISEATGLPVELDDRLAEQAFGDWEGRLRDEVALDHPELFRTPAWLFAAPGGETYDETLARASAFLADLPPEPHRRVIAVSHGVTGRLIRAAYAGLDRDAVLQMAVPQDAVYRLQNGQIDRFDCEPVE
jgi:probable phosphoglycerate mutase